MRVTTATGEEVLLNLGIMACVDVINQGKTVEIRFANGQRMKLGMDGVLNDETVLARLLEELGKTTCFVGIGSGPGGKTSRYLNLSLLPLVSVDHDTAAIFSLSEEARSYGAKDRESIGAGVTRMT